MINVEKKAKELVVDIAKEVTKSLYRQGLLNEPKAMQNEKIRPMVEALIKKMKPSKYDPCRPFRKGDSVRPVERYGRMPDDGAPVNVICEVVEDECKNGTVAILARRDYGSVRFRVTALYLELVTPVEELKPYYVKEFIETVQIRRDGCGSFVASYDKESHPNAKEAAEAERDRLNAEHRKELEK